MRQDELDIMFVPVYLQAHFLLKALFWFYSNSPPPISYCVSVACMSPFIKMIGLEW